MRKSEEVTIQEVSVTIQDAEIDAVLGNLSIMPEHLYIGGHSLGGAYALNTLQMVQEFNWGSETLVVNTEMASSRPMQELWQPDFSDLPEATIVHLAVGEDDMTVGQCDSVYHQQLFNLIEKNNSLLIFIQSDKYMDFLDLLLPITFQLTRHMIPWLIGLSIDELTHRQTG